jgi:hypothetical protein
MTRALNCLVGIAGLGESGRLSAMSKISFLGSVS